MLDFARFLANKALKTHCYVFSRYSSGRPRVIIFTEVLNFKKKRYQTCVYSINGAAWHSTMIARIKDEPSRFNSQVHNPKLWVDTGFSVNEDYETLNYLKELHTKGYIDLPVLDILKIETEAQKLLDIPF